MSDLFTAVSFTVHLQLREARLAAECGELCDELDVLSFDKDVAGLDRAFDKRSDAFKQAFPRGAANEDPFASFRKIFDDPSYLAINVDIDFEDHDGDETSIVPVTFSSNVAEIVTLANLIRAACASALPTGFVFSTYGTKNTVGEPNGGFALIQADDVAITWADRLLKDALSELREPTPLSAPLRERTPVMRLIDDHIRNDVTDLVRELLKEIQSSSIPRLTEQAKALNMPFVDYRQAASENGWIFEDGAWRGYNWDDFSSWQQADAANRCETLRTAEDVCSENKLAPEQHAITGFYAVSPWLAARLRGFDERVDTKFSKLCVWARWWEAGSDLLEDPILNKIASETERYQ